jgi:hypothetical protein
MISLVHKAGRILSTLRLSTFPNDLVNSRPADTKTRPFIGFNQQFLRATVVLAVARAFHSDPFVETGTNAGSTSFLVDCQSRLPIYTCELNSRSYIIARRRLMPFGKRVTAINGDSPEFLR